VIHHRGGVYRAFTPEMADQMHLPFVGGRSDELRSQFNKCGMTKKHRSRQHRVSPYVSLEINKIKIPNKYSTLQYQFK
jgi:hypothetical protein